MKSELRKIIINNEVYYYRFSYKYHKQPNDEWKCISSFRVFTYKNKNAPFTIIIETIADAIYGNILNIRDGKIDINLNCPKWARKIILFAIKNGWDGKEKKDISCTYESMKEILLRNMSFD